MNNLFVIDTDQRFNKGSMKLITQLEHVGNGYTKRCMIYLFFCLLLLWNIFMLFDQNKNKILKCFLALYKQCLDKVLL